jgi:hypothetical protein
MPVFVPFLSLVESGDGFPYEVLDDLGGDHPPAVIEAAAGFPSLMS